MTAETNAIREIFAPEIRGKATDPPDTIITGQVCQGFLFKIFLLILFLSIRIATLAMDTTCATGTTAGRTARPRRTITAAVIAAVETCVLAEARGTRRHCDCAYVVCV